MYISTNKERCVILGTYLIENNTTVRAVASKFGISKSTVHKDITENLKEINPILYSQVQEVLNINKKERHLRGGEATRKKYLNQNNYRIIS
jgi:putative DeoR family transcriptional regulator (stage III sporulation protein D)